jgi:hypothetical protein
MLFMLIIKSSRLAEKNPPRMDLREKMDVYNDALDAAGVKVMAKGLYPDAQGYKLLFNKDGKEPELIRGPFLKDNNQIAGFFILELPSMTSALEWLKKAPDPQGFGEGEIELRQIR